MKVSNMTSHNGNTIPNQFIITDGETEVFQSYHSVIVKKVGETIFLDEKYWDYSVTTSKYRNLFLGEDKKATQKKIDTGIYTLCNLN